jgi:hypothetical protein
MRPGISPSAKMACAWGEEFAVLALGEEFMNYSVHYWP